MACVCRQCKTIFEPPVLQCPLCKETTEMDDVSSVYYEEKGYRLYSGINQLTESAAQASPLSTLLISPEDPPPETQPDVLPAYSEQGPTPAERLTQWWQRLLRFREMLQAFQHRIPWRFLFICAAFFLVLTGVIAGGRYLWENRYLLFNDLLNVGIAVLIFAGIIKFFLWCFKSIFKP